MRGHSRGCTWFLAWAWAAGTWACAYLPESALDSLAEGDVRMRVWVRGVEGAVPAAGARALLVGSARAVRSTDKGSVTVRNLPRGPHAVEVTFQERADGTSAYGARVPFTIRTRNGRRTALDLGDVTLKQTGSFSGVVRLARDRFVFAGRATTAGNARGPAW